MVCHGPDSLASDASRFSFGSARPGTFYGAGALSLPNDEGKFHGFLMNVGCARSGIAKLIGVWTNGIIRP